MKLTDLQKRILLCTQEGIPIISSPYREIAQKLGISENEIVRHILDMKEKGIIRRFGASIGHRDIGIVANAMCVWNVPDTITEEIGKKMADCKDVTHCYVRPRHNDWPYNMFTMVHSYSREECLDIAQNISIMTGITDYDVLFSEKEFKKVGIRL